MVIVRTARESDIDSVLELAKQAYPGMTTLPPDRDVLAAKLALSETSIAKQVGAPKDETYFLLMEDTQTHSIVGTAAIIACLGSVDEFYSYKLNKVTHSCKELNKKISFEMLNLSNHFEGSAEVATLYLSKAYRKHGNGKFLARTRYLFMAQFRERFPEYVMADLRGYFDEHGRSPFWEAVGAHFFEMGFAEADLYGAINGNQFIADLMPKQPIYINMLPESARRVIGRPNSRGKPALEMLNSEGFRWNGHVDIFDAAPSVDTKIDDIATIKNSRDATVIGVSKSAGKVQAMVVNKRIETFVGCVAPVSIETSGIKLPPTILKTLNIELGDSVRYLVM